jgi:hypothetical protein
VEMKGGVLRRQGIRPRVHDLASSDNESQPMGWLVAPMALISCA